MEGGRRRATTPKLDDRPTTAPPITTSTQTSPETKFDFTDLENVPVDKESLFSCNTDWLHLGKAMEFLQDQYEQCLQDIAQLEELKAAALNDPVGFVNDLKVHKRALDAPDLQTIYRVPEIDTERFSVRATRRGLNKKEQNSEFFLSRIKELQQRGSVILPVPMRSDKLTIDSENLKSHQTPPVNNLRQQYLSVVKLQNDTGSISEQHRSSNSTPSVSATHSLNSSSASSTPSKKKKQKSIQNQNTYNIPWTKEEKKKLNELLLEYPEEPVAARRYAKIAAALGSRTSTQVFTRVSKLLATKRAHFDISDDDQDQSTMKADTPEYREYMKLKQALEAELLGTDSIQVHSGTICSLCNARPIIGSRFRCLECLVDLCDTCYVPGQSNSHNHHRVQLMDTPNINVSEFDYLNP